MTVVPQDIAVELGRPSFTDLERDQWDSWISQARYLIGKRLGDISLLNQTDVDYVTLQAVVAHVRRPDDATRVDVTIDDASTSRTYTSGRGMVTITDELWAVLDADLGDAGAFSVTPYSVADTDPSLTSWF